MLKAKVRCVLGSVATYVLESVFGPMYIKLLQTRSYILFAAYLEKTSLTNKSKVVIVTVTAALYILR